MVKFVQNVVAEAFKVVESALNHAANLVSHVRTLVAGAEATAEKDVHS